MRLTGDPYIVHCVETASIVESLHTGPRAPDALAEMDERCFPACALFLFECGLPDMRPQYSPCWQATLGHVSIMPFMSPWSPLGHGRGLKRSTEPRRGYLWFLHAQHVFLHAQLLHCNPNP